MSALGLMATGGGTALGSSLLQFGLQRSAADIQRSEAKAQATGEELAAKARESDRKSRLASALASQNAMAGAKGVAAFEGSPLSILESDISAEKNATERDKFMAQLRSDAIRSGAKIKERQIKTGASIGLLGDIGKQVYQIGKGIG